MSTTPLIRYVDQATTIKRFREAGSDKWKWVVTNYVNRIEIAIPIWLDGHKVQVQLPGTDDHVITFTPLKNPPEGKVECWYTPANFKIALGRPIYNAYNMKNYTLVRKTDSDGVWQFKDINKNPKSIDPRVLFDVEGADTDEMKVTSRQAQYFPEEIAWTWIEFALGVIVWRCLRDYPAIQVSWATRKISLWHGGERVFIGSKDWAGWAKEKTLRVAILRTHIFEFCQLASGIQLKAGRHELTPVHIPKETQYSDETAGWIQLHDKFSFREDTPVEAEAHRTRRSVMIDNKCIVWRFAEGNPDDKLFRPMTENSGINSFDLLETEDKAYIYAVIIADFLSGFES
ncbi:hypothetical protein DFH06DRAFT_1325311 [Mycena polygramma]|nr:hypothetical protein DFH06DRAFT_1325311 [Mycena polygramma]